MALFAASSAVAQPLTKRFEIQGHGSLQLAVAADWRISVKQPEGPMPTILELRAPSGELLLISVFPNVRDDPDFTAPAALRAQAERSGRKILHTAVESELVLQELRGAAGTGFYYSLTDKSLVGKVPSPGEFRRLTQGLLGTDSFRLVFTVLTNESVSPTHEQALRILGTAKRVKTS